MCNEKIQSVKYVQINNGYSLELSPNQILYQ